MPYLNTLDPIAISLGPLQVRWYGLMYVLGALVGYWIGRARAREGRLGMTQDQYSDLASATCWCTDGANGSRTRSRCSGCGRAA
jgi:prolipoprotein diacylglyceryltransferase